MSLNVSPASGLVSTSALLLRHRCRHLSCGLKLKHGPTDNRLDAFCCQGCFDSHYRSRCLVCERPFTRKTERRQVCDRSKCRHEFQRHRERFSSTRYPASVLGHNGSRSADKSGLKIGTFGGRPFRIVAGPTLNPASLRLASLPLDPELVARLDRAHATYVENRAKTKRSAARRALIKRHHPPVNILGGYRFAGAPVLDLSPIEAPVWATTSRWKPTGAGADVPSIPEFLCRATAAAPIAAGEEPPPCPAAAPIEIGTSEEVV
jgi:hypothetical protein